MWTPPDDCQGHVCRLSISSLTGEDIPSGARRKPHVPPPVDTTRDTSLVNTVLTPLNRQMPNYEGGPAVLPLCAPSFLIANIQSTPSNVSNDSKRSDLLSASPSVINSINPQVTPVSGSFHYSRSIRSPRMGGGLIPPPENIAAVRVPSPKNMALKQQYCVNSECQNAIEKIRRGSSEDGARSGSGSSSLSSHQTTITSKSESPPDSPC